MSIASSGKRTAICNTCTRRLVVIAYRRHPWFRLVREPLKLTMSIWVAISRIDHTVYEVRSPSCYDCTRFRKTALKEHSALFRWLNKLVNPVFDAILEGVVSREEVNKAEAHARAAALGEELPHDGNQHVEDLWWNRV